MTIASRAPEGMPNHCLLCGADMRLEPSQPGGAPCPHCGCLVWHPVKSDLDGPVAMVDFASLLTASSKPMSYEQIHAEMRKWRPLLDSCAVLMVRFKEGSYLPSACIGEIVWLHTTARKLQRQLLIIAPRRSPLREILELTRLDTVLQIFEDENAALDSIA